VAVERGTASFKAIWVKNLEKRRACGGKDPRLKKAREAMDSR